MTPPSDPTDPTDPTVTSHDRGAALVVAVAFVIMIGTIVAGLTAMVTSGIDTRAALEEIRDREYAADGAIEQAIASSATEVGLGALECDDDTPSTATVDAVAIRVDRLVICDAALDVGGLPVTQISAVFTACEDTGATCAAGDVVVRALVGFELAADGTVAHVPVYSWSVTR